MLGKLEEMFRLVRKSLLAEKAKLGREMRVNPKGDTSYRFDLRAEELAVDYCKKNLRFPVRILSEESGEILTKAGTPKYTLVIDPVDGSTNFKRGIELSGFSVAVLSASKPLAVQNVLFGLVGNLFTGSIVKAEKGKGATVNGDKATTSNVIELRKALVNIDLDFDEMRKNSRVLPIMHKVFQMRRIGSGSIELALVATGGFDAHIDVRDKLTPENFMAGYLLIREAGGIFTDPYGEELPEIESFTKPFNIVASGNMILHKQIIELLQM